VPKVELSWGLAVALAHRAPSESTGRSSVVSRERCRQQTPFLRASHFRPEDGKLCLKSKTMCADTHRHSGRGGEKVEPRELGYLRGRPGTQGDGKTELIIDNIRSLPQLTDLLTGNKYGFSEKILTRHRGAKTEKKKVATRRGFPKRDQGRSPRLEIKGDDQVKADKEGGNAQRPALAAGRESEVVGPGQTPGDHHSEPETTASRRYVRATLIVVERSRKGCARRAPDVRGSSRRGRRG